MPLVGADRMALAWAEDRATLGSDPSADSGAKTEAGCRKMPRFVLELRDWHKAINPIKRGSPSLFVRLFIAGQLRFRAPAPRTALENVTMMEEAVEHRGHSGSVAQQLAPVVDRSV